MGLQCRNTKILFGPKLSEGLNKRGQGWNPVNGNTLGGEVGINEEGLFRLFWFRWRTFTKQPRLHCERVITRNIYREKNGGKGEAYSRDSRKY